MNSNDTTFAGSIPELYDQYLVPLCFQPYAEELGERLGTLTRGTLLETAAGTGAVTRVLARTLSPEVRIVATDLNPGMLAVAQRLASPSNVAWRQADAQKLPFADAEFDAVVCQFGMMFLPDKLAGLREARRVLAPTGRFVFSVWGALSDNPVSDLVGHAVASIFAGDPPHFFERTPFGYGDPERLRGDLAQAGFSRVAIDVVDRTTHTTPEKAALALCQGTPMRGEIEARGTLSEVTAAVAAALRERLGASIESRMRALVVTAS